MKYVLLVRKELCLVQYYTMKLLRLFIHVFVTHLPYDGATRTLLKNRNVLVGLAGPAPDEIVLDLSIRK